MKNLIAFVAVAASATLPLFAEEDENFVMTSEPVTFCFNSAEVSPYGVAAADSFAPVTYKAGESVSMTAPDGTVTPRVTSASADGTFSFVPTCGGVWTLTNSKCGSVLVAVPWAIYGESGSVGTDTATFAADTVQEGPNRETKKREALPIAYSGDNWLRDVTKAATVTFTPPADSGLEPTVWDRTGTSADSFTFSKSGDWTVTLRFENGTEQTAIITVKKAGFIVFVR